MRNALADECVYTIVHRDHLEAAFRSGQPARFRESKRWTRGAELLAEARQDGRILPIVFADAADWSGLIFWGELRDVRLDDEGTEYAVANLRRVPGTYAPQDLTLLRSGKRIAPDFIRPYALCRTPSFLSQA